MILICEDDPIFAHRLEGLVKAYLEKHPSLLQVDVVFSLGGLDSWDLGFGDLLLLDIVLPDGSGLAWMQKAHEKGADFDVVYISSFEPDLVLLANSRPYGFIRKEAGQEALEDALSALLDAWFQDDKFVSPQRFFYTCKEGAFCLAKRQILYFEKEARRIIPHTDSGPEPAFYATMKGLLEDIDRQGLEDFVQISQAHVVHIPQIEKLDSKKWVLILKNGEILPISTNYRKDVRTQLMAYFTRRVDEASD